MQAHFLRPLLKRKAFLLRLSKGSNFLQSALWIWITKRFSLVRECNVFLQCCITLGPARQFSLQNVKLSRIVIYRSKIIRMKCSLNWSYINLLWRIELWHSKLQLSVFLKILTGARSLKLWISLTVLKLEAFEDASLPQMRHNFKILLLWAASAILAPWGRHQSNMADIIESALRIKIPDALFSEIVHNNRNMLNRKHKPWI